MVDSSRDFLIELLEQYWFAPPVALWRSVELRKLATLRYQRPILDLGCGDGLISQILFSGSSPIEFGFDPWFDQVRQAPSSNSYEAVQQAVGDAMPYRDGSFASIFSNSVLEHIPDIEPVLKEVYRVLMPEGVFVATVPSDAFRFLLAGYKNRLAAGNQDAAELYATTVDRCLEHHRYLSPDEWDDLFDQFGFRMLDSLYYIPSEVAAVWDRFNRLFGIHKPGIPFYRWLASPRFRKFGYQKLMKSLIVNIFSRRWRRLYEMEVGPASRGAGLMVVAKKKV
jgi:SAM-dependent methyltransferase